MCKNRKNRYAITPAGTCNREELVRYLKRRSGCNRGVVEGRLANVVGAASQIAIVQKVSGAIRMVRAEVLPSLGLDGRCQLHYRSLALDPFYAKKLNLPVRAHRRSSGRTHLQQKKRHPHGRRRALMCR